MVTHVNVFVCGFQSILIAFTLLLIMNAISPYCLFLISHQNCEKKIVSCDARIRKWLFVRSKTRRAFIFNIHLNLRCIF